MSNNQAVCCGIRDAKAAIHRLTPTPKHTEPD
jgi:hypothetical protein